MCRTNADNVLSYIHIRPDDNALLRRALNTNLAELNMYIPPQMVNLVIIWRFSCFLQIIMRKSTNKWIFIWWNGKLYLPLLRFLKNLGIGLQQVKDYLIIYTIIMKIKKTFNLCITLPDSIFGKCTERILVGRTEYSRYETAFSF